MEAHPSYPVLASLLAKYPRAAGALFQTYNDILFSQQWTDVQPLDLPACSRGAVKGRKPASNSDAEPSCVVPCSMAETMSISWLQDAFRDLENPKEIFLAITTEDASIVYYKISQGIVKPPV
ncbi:hypothetical protein FIBSPDRAFT_916846 [Athelia psychrophila]|uniref:tRNA-splicing endonuclease subunit Sen15 domain-containing protein n=1 Tax=Athelia psychrophila TaxID=1759441 RepID=A0A166UER1_9AGAM|nr:hypothetical protein FIBSPDRAFT_916846 [Fibularhizoctonia sp. CBS 109695]